MNLNLAGGGAMLCLASIGWTIAGFVGPSVAGYVGAGLFTIGMVMIGLDVETDDSGEMAFDAEDLE
jgi:hypothetical protein